MRFFILILFLSFSLFAASQNPAGDTSRHRVGLRVSGISGGDSLLIALSYLGDEPFIMIVKPAPGIQYFPIRYKIGDTLLLSQWDWSTKQCSFEGANASNMVRIIIGDSDRIINCNCGIPNATYRVGLRVNNVDPGNSTRIQFNYKGRPIWSVGFIEPGKVEYCPTRFSTGDTIEIKQLGGSRICSLDRFIVGNNDTILDGNCVAFARRVGIRLAYVDPDPARRYKFTCSFPGRSTTEVQISTANLTYYYSFLYKKGDTAQISQTGGPMLLQLRPWPPVVQDSDLILTADVQGMTKTKISGTYTAPPGTKITIRNNGGDDLLLTAPAFNAAGNNTIDFRFPKDYSNGTSYNITINSQPVGCTCAVLPLASGTTPVDSSGLRIICSPKVELVSRSSDNRAFNTFYESTAPVVGGKGEDEGRFVAYVSSGVGVDGATGKYRQIFLRDMRTGITKMISRSSNGDEGNGNSFAPSISADGRSVAFESYAGNLSSGDVNNGLRDVYVWQEGRGVSLVSRGGNGESFEPSISGNGSVVAFSSSASNLAPGVEGTSTVNVYVADATGSIQLITKDIKTKKGAGGSAPSISEDGNKVVFCSYAYTLVENDQNNLWDIFLWQRGSLGLKKISLTSTGADRDQGFESASRVVSPSISGNGNYVVYATTATNMVNGDYNKVQDIFICNIGGTGVRRLSVTADNTEADGDNPIDQGGRIGINYDGSWICYNTNATNLGVGKGNIILQNTRTGRIIPVTNSKNISTGRPVLSASGAYVVAGCSEKFDPRFASSGIFSFFTGSSIQ